MKWEVIYKNLPFQLRINEALWTVCTNMKF